MMFRRAALALLLVMSLAAGGCGFLVGAGIGAAGAYAGYRYEQGKFETAYRQPYEKVYEASLASLKEMNISVGSVTEDAAGASIEGQRADGTDVSLDLSKAGPETTQAAIRVGLLGDEQASRTIADAIAARLGEAERQPTGRGGGEQQAGGQAGGSAGAQGQPQEHDIGDQ